MKHFIIWVYNNILPSPPTPYRLLPLYYLFVDDGIISLTQYFARYGPHTTWVWKLWHGVGACLKCSFLDPSPTLLTRCLWGVWPGTLYFNYDSTFKAQLASAFPLPHAPFQGVPIVLKSNTKLSVPTHLLHSSLSGLPLNIIWPFLKLINYVQTFWSF